MEKTSPVVVVRGGGDIATAVICRLHRCGFRVVVLETANPTAIRRTVSLSEAVYEGNMTVEGVSAELIARVSDCSLVWERRRVPVLIDPEAHCLHELRATAVVDAVLAKRNCGTARDMAPVTIALGPGFIAGIDVDAVIETARGHDLGRITYNGSALPDTGIPGEIMGITSERVCYAPQDGILEVLHDIGSRVESNEPLAVVGKTVLESPFSGIVRGMLRHGSQVRKGLKVADIDPRYMELKNFCTISDKARNISGSVLETLLVLLDAGS